MTWAELSDADKRAQVRDAIMNRHESYGQAAARLGTTRNSIAGVVERSRRSGEPIPRMATERLQQVRRASVAKARAAKPPRPKKEKRVPKPRKPKFAFIPDIPEDAIDRVPARTDVWNALPGSSPVPVELHTNGCRFPIGADLPFAFCNEPVEDGPYCQQHSAIAFRPALPVTRLPKGARS